MTEVRTQSLLSRRSQSREEGIPKPGIAKQHGKFCNKNNYAYYLLTVFWGGSACTNIVLLVSHNSSNK